MLKELFDAIGDQARRAHGAHIISCDDEPGHVYLVKQGDGTIKKFHAEPEPRNHKALSLHAIVERVRDWDGRKDYPQDVSYGGPCIWFSRQGVVLLIDDATRRDRITLSLSYSKQLNRLAALEQSNYDLDQKAIILELRTTFAHCDEVPNLVKALRDVRFRQEEDGRTVVQHGKSSVGKSAMAELKGTSELPEYFHLQVPIFANAFPELVQEIELALEPLPEKQAFRLIPLPGQIEYAIAEAEAAIGDEIKRRLKDAHAESVPIYYGMP